MIILIYVIGFVLVFASSIVKIGRESAQSSGPLVDAITAIDNHFESLNSKGFYSWNRTKEHLPKDESYPYITNFVAYLVISLVWPVTIPIGLLFTLGARQGRIAANSKKRAEELKTAVDVEIERIRQAEGWAEPVKEKGSY